MKRHCKLISIILTISILFTLLPVGVFAQQSGEETNAASIEQPEQPQGKAEAKIMGEVVEKREKNVKHFIKDDMSFEAAVYPTAVHYKEGDKWEDIDNTLVGQKDEDNNDVLENKKNAYKIKIAKNTNANKLVSIKQDGYELAWGIENANKAMSNVKQADDTQLGQLDENEKKKILKNISSTVEFLNVFQDVDLEYHVKPEEVKEYIILNKKVDKQEFTFNLSLNKLEAKLGEDGTIVFYDEKDASKEVFKMQAPFMYDANNETSKDIKVSLTNEKGSYKLTLEPSKEWLDSAERVYPVKIDPWVQTVNSAAYVQDTYVVGFGPATNYIYGHEEIMRLPSTMFISFVLPTLTPADMITDAYLNLYLVSSSPSQYLNSAVGVHKVLGSWNENAINWNTQPSYKPEVEDYRSFGNFSASQSGYYQSCQWNITSITKEWYSTGNNFGVALTSKVGDYCDFKTSEFDNGYCAPTAKIYYMSNLGLENYWTYHSQSVGRAGNGYVNDSTGNLVFVHNDLSMNGNRMPLTLNHVYNSGEKNSNIGFGLGWRLNLSEKLEYQGNYYAYTDGDGTIHYFDLSRKYYDWSLGMDVYKDDSGLNLSLVWSGWPGNDVYNVIDKEGNVRIFKLINNTNGIYNLTKIVDSNRNAIELGYDTDGKTLKTVTDGAGRITTLNYQNGKLSTITDPAGRTTYYLYSGDQLTRITYLDSNNSLYTYDTNNNLTEVTNYDGYKMVYSYYNAAPYKVRKVQEMHTNGTLGQELNIEYNNNTTTFTDVAGRKNTYQFNNYGNTVSIRDAEGNAQYYKYLRGSNINNKLSVQSKLQKSVLNYLKNHSMEFDDSWIPYYGGSTTGTSDYTTEDKYMGNRSLKVVKTNTLDTQSYYQKVSLEKGKQYTFSAFIKTSGVSSINNRGAGLIITYQDGAGKLYSILSPFIKGTNEWQRCEVKFTLPTDMPYYSVNMHAGISKETGTAYFDCLQLEEGAIANRYNLIENPDFTYGTDSPTYWTKSSDCESSDILTTLSNVEYPKGLDNKVFTINGIPSRYKNLYQNINVSGKKGDVLSVGGWAKGYSAPANASSFTIKVVLNGSLGTQIVYIPFTQNTPDWQYVADRIVAANDYTSVTLSLLYERQVNTAYFDGLQLYKEEFGTSYQYDSNGNVVSTADLAAQNSQFQYSTNNDMIKSIDPKGSEFKYNYDRQHNLLDATSAENVVYSFTYDGYGNPLTAKVGNSTLFISSSSTYTANGNYLKTITDASGNTATYNYNETKGTLSSMVDAKGKTTSYTYDALDRLESVSKTVEGQAVVNSYSYENDRLNQIAHNGGVNYAFRYDSLGNSTQVLVGSQPLVTNSYEARTSKLLGTTYGNGQTVSSDYDNLDRVVAKKYNGSVRYRYEYDASGNMGYHEDLVSGINYRFFYDMADRLARIVDSQGYTTGYGYDLNNNINSISEKLDSRSYITAYEYDKDNRLKKVTAPNSSYTSYVYDTVNRLSSTTVNTGAAQYNTTYGYFPGVNGSSTNRLQTISNNGSPISYTYDANGNIETITQNGNTIKYYYNELNELIREDNKVIGKTITYSYDAGGNITSKKEYSYTSDAVPSTLIKAYAHTYDSVWRDKLASYDGKAITYDAIGNPLNDGVYTYTWEEGRQLASINGNGYSMSFKYNDSGIRTEKTANGVTTKYRLLGDRVTYETNGTDSIYYTYDASKKLISMNLNGAEYYYIRNGQGDIIGLFDGTGAQVVGYTYDTWGKLVSTTGALASTVGVKNPYRYKGYRYDTETGLYYLQSRYYNPEWGRFINADGYVFTNLLGANTFVYCYNNPIILCDLDGRNAVVAGAMIGGATGGPVGAVIGVGVGILITGIGIVIIDNVRQANDTSSNNPLPPPTPNNWDDWKQRGGPGFEFLPKMFVTTKALKEVYEKWKQPGVNAFIDAAKRGLVGDSGMTGITKLSGGIIKNGVKYTHEIKLFKQYADYRIFGYKNSFGEWIFDWFRKGLH